MMSGGVVRSMEFQKAEAKRGLLWSLMDNIYPIVRRVVRPRDLVEKTTGSGNYLSLIENGLMAFGGELSLTGNKPLGFLTETYATDFLGAPTDSGYRPMISPIFQPTAPRLYPPHR